MNSAARLWSGWWLLLLLLGSGALAADDRHYRIDGGDLLDVVVPRYPEFTRLYPVTQAGTIVVDLLGDVPVRGLTPGELEQKLTTQLAAFLRHPQQISVRVAARRMLVRVVGQVGEPGLKEVPKDSNVQEIVAAAGGPLLGAVLDRVVIRRKHADWIEELPVDLKLYLERRGELPAVRNGDEIFVPRVETDGAVQRPLTAAEITAESGWGRVQVLGAVGQPGEVPLREGGSLLAVLTAAGGWAETADLSRLRIVPGGQGAAREVDLQAWLEQGGSLPAVQPGDVISVPSRVAPTRMVKVLGAVAQPGPVQLSADADLQAALTAAGGALPNGDTRHIRLMRTAGAELLRREVDLEAYLAGDATPLPALQSGDVIFVPKGSQPVQSPAAMVYIFGAVTKPGAYPLMEQRPLLHLLAQAGGAGATANLRAVRITPAAGGRGSSFDLQAWQDGQGGELPTLHDGDVVTVDPNRLTVVGDVAKPGPVEVASKASVVDAIVAAGGPSATADLSRVILTRLGAAGPERTAVNLEQYLYRPEQAPPLPEVRAGDVVSVTAGTVDAQVAFVLGAVNRPGSVTLPGKRASLLYVLAQAGGVLPSADREQVRIIRPAAGKLEVELCDLKALQAGSGPGIPEVRPGDLVSVDELGRPGRGVLVLGAVARQGRQTVEDGQTVIDTIGAAGGLVPNADPSRGRLVHPDGSVEELDLTTYTKTGVPSPLIRDGDVLVIAYKRDARPLWEDLLRIFPFVSFLIR
ncbi:MAG: SLBB domain-containing protein [Fimbriimonadaceae bacterium]|nr:SLBB domain-containing protein [Fimbriimonadaceae bacterium]